MADANYTETQVRAPGGFGKRRETPTIIVNRNGVTRQYRISPLLASFSFSVIAVFMVGYLVATAYLVLRDDLIGMTQARNARLMHEYEDRIAALRANLDRVTSRQLLDQQAIEARVEELMRRQDMLSGRSTRIGKLIDEARRRGLGSDEAAPQETGNKPDSITTGSLQTGDGINFASMGLRGSRDGISGETSPTQAGSSFMAMEFRPGALPDITNIPLTQRMFASIDGRIDEVDDNQRALLSSLRLSAAKRSERIAGILGSLDVELPDEVATSVGGPFVPLDEGAGFDNQVEALDHSLVTLDLLGQRIDRLPVANPVPGKPVSSHYGSRMDPFVGRKAMHLGTDFRARSGSRVHAAASGTIKFAGRRGGYGNLVEIDHGNGLITRFAHLSRILVAKGDKVVRGAVVGKVGSTGRSTGPHLHYEVRRNGRALNPARFLKAGRELKNLMKKSG